MSHLSGKATDEDLLRFIDQWAVLMEAEDYEAAYRYTAHDRHMGWTADLLREVVKTYGDCDTDQKVTVDGKPTDVTQRKKVDRWPMNDHGYIGEIWYDLNIDGFASDLTATFGILESVDGLTIELSNIHVM